MDFLNLVTYIHMLACTVIVTGSDHYWMEYVTKKNLQQFHILILWRRQKGNGKPYSS